MISLTPEQLLALFGLFLALGYAFIRWRDARNAVIIANAKRIEQEAAAEKVASDTSSAAVKAVTEGFARKDSEVSKLRDENDKLQRRIGELETDVATFKERWEASKRVIDDKNSTIEEKNKSLQDCVSANQTVNDRLLNITAELESIRAQYAAEIESTINRHLDDKDTNDHDS